MARDRVGGVLIVATVGVVLAHALGLLSLASPGTREFYSDIMNGVAALAATAGCAYAAWRSRGIPRQFWILICSAFVIWTVGEALWTFEQDVAHYRPQPGPADVVFFLAFTPAILAVFLPEDERGQIDWLWALDLLQVGIVLVTAYLAVFYVSSEWGMNGDRTLAKQVFVVVGRNILVSALFLLRAVVSRTRRMQGLFLRMGFALAVYAACTSIGNEYLFVSKAWPFASWPDLLWSVPLGLVALAAITWKPGEEGVEQEEPWPVFRRIGVQYALPAVLPVLALWIALYIPQRQVGVSFALIAASFVCYTARMTITEFRHHRTASALHETEEKFQRVFDRNPQPMWLVDLKSLRFLEVNEAAVTQYGISRGGFLRRTLGDIQAQPDCEEMVQTLRMNAPYVKRIQHRRKDDTRIDVEVIAQGLKFAQTETAVVMAQDITEQLRLEEQLRQSQKMEAIGTLAGGVAHDFNNLLTVIHGYSELLMEQLKDDEQQSREIQRIQDAASRAGRLTRQLLTFSRRQVLEPRVMSLNLAVANVDNMLRRVIGEDVELVTRLDPKLGSIKADPGQIEQVIMNLAVNARDAMPKGGRLIFETVNMDVDSSLGRRLHADLPPGHYVMLTVSDTGTGMDDETQAHIFEPFFTTKKGKGTGLGLATVYGIAKQSGGTITVESEVNKGSSFRLYFPRVDRPAELADSGFVKSVGTAPSGSETILLVEDDDSLRELSRKILQKSGYTVVTSSKAAEAEKICREYPGKIELLLTDVVMPELSGHELVERVATIRPGMKVLYMSGYSDRAVHEGIKDGAFLHKPFSPGVLAQKVREMLDS